jgi:hypothetical protein
MIELNFTDWNFVLTVITALGVIVAVVSLIFQTRGEKNSEFKQLLAELKEEIDNEKINGEIPKRRKGSRGKF